MKPQPAHLKLVFDGGCPFCQAFAQLSELKGGLPQLEIIDGRANSQLRQALKAQGYPLSKGAILMVDPDNGDAHGTPRIVHGPAAVSLLCRHLRPSTGLVQLLKVVFANRERTEFLYPLLLWVRRLALSWRSLPVDPDHNAMGSGRSRSRRQSPAQCRPMQRPTQRSY